MTPANPQISPNAARIERLLQDAFDIINTEAPEPKRLSWVYRFLEMVESDEGPPWRTVSFKAQNACALCFEVPLRLTAVERLLREVPGDDIEVTARATYARWQLEQMAHMMRLLEMDHSRAMEPEDRDAYRRGYENGKEYGRDLERGESAVELGQARQTIEVLKAHARDLAEELRIALKYRGFPAIPDSPALRDHDTLHVMK